MMSGIFSMLTAMVWTRFALAFENLPFYFDPMSFVKNLKYMGLGMLAIFLVIGVIVGITCLLNAIFKDRKQ